MILEQCKGVRCVDLGESFPTHIFLQNFFSIQPRTSLVKFAGHESPEASRIPSKNACEQVTEHGNLQRTRTKPDDGKRKLPGSHPSPSSVCESRAIFFLCFRIPKIPNCWENRQDFGDFQRNSAFSRTSVQHLRQFDEISSKLAKVATVIPD